jgi:hypothetical protein
LSKGEPLRVGDGWLVIVLQASIIVPIIRDSRNEKMLVDLPPSASPDNRSGTSVVVGPAAYLSNKPFTENSVARLISQVLKS